MRLMVFRTVIHVVSSHQTRECFTDRCDIPWNPPTIFHPDLIATIQQRCLPQFCALLFQQHKLSLFVWCRRTMISCWFFTSLAKFQGIGSVNDFTLPIWLQELVQALLCFLRSFRFYMGVIVSTVLSSLAPLQRIDDCFEIHILH